MVFSKPSLPIPPEAFAKEEDGDLRPYMEGVSIPHMEAEIGLLIGSDVP